MPVPSPEPIVTHMAHGEYPRPEWSSRAYLEAAVAVSGWAASPGVPSPSWGPSGGASLAQSSSNSTRHLPASSRSILSLARKVRPERPLKPGTGFSVRPTGDVPPRSIDVVSDAISSLTTGAGRFLPALNFQITNPQPGSSRVQHE